MQLPVFDIITEACRRTWEGRRDFAAFAFLPVLVVSIVGVVTAPVIGDPRIVIDNPQNVPAPVLAH